MGEHSRRRTKGITAESRRRARIHLAHEELKDESRGLCAWPADGVTFLDCDAAEAARIGLEAAAGKNLEVFSPTIGRQLLERRLIDEIDLHVAPILLGDGIRLYDNPGGAPIRLDLVNGDDPSAAVNVRYRPTATS